MSSQFAFIGDSLFGTVGAPSSTYQSGIHLCDRLLLHVGHAGGVDRSALVLQTKVHILDDSKCPF